MFCRPSGCLTNLKLRSSLHWLYLGISIFHAHQFLDWCNRKIVFHWTSFSTLVSALAIISYCNRCESLLSTGASPLNKSYIYCTASPTLFDRELEFFLYMCWRLFLQVFAITFLPIMVMSCIVWVQAQAKTKDIFNPGVTATESKCLMVIF